MAVSIGQNLCSPFWLCSICHISSSRTRCRGIPDAGWPEKSELTDLSLNFTVRLLALESLFAPLLEGASLTIPPEAAEQLVELSDEAAQHGLLAAAETCRSLASFEQGLSRNPLDPRDVAQIRLLLGNLAEDFHSDTSRTRLASTSSLVEPIAPTAPNPNDRVALYLDSRAVAVLLQDVLKRHGFLPFVITSMGKLGEPGRDKPPAAIVADLSLCREDPDTLKIITALREQILPPPHLFCLAGADDIAARLEAVRLGATRFMPKPLDISRLLAILRGVTERAPAEPLRALLVDDDPLQTMLHGAELAEAGLEVLSTNDPLEAPALVESFRPDVIVIDLYMPGCNGLELAALLRQDDALADTPILFLSAETNIPRQMVALGLGGDDFITKPVLPEVLQAAVIARAKRARMLRRTREEYRRLSGQFQLGLATGPAMAPTWRFDAVQRQLVVPNGIRLSLTSAEAALVQQLFSRPGGNTTRQQLIASLRDLPGVYDDRRLEALISRLRRKVREKSGVKLPLQSEYGRGYSFTGHVLVL